MTKKFAKNSADVPAEFKKEGADITAYVNTASAFWGGVLNVLNTIWPIIVALLLFSVVIFIHEFGHFIFAKMFKIRVNEFSMGFGPKLLSRQGKTTLYSWRLLPFGGFCAMEGEDEESDDENSFQKKSIWKRILVVFAGAFFNLILGFILACLFLSMTGVAGTTMVAGFDSEDSKSISCGLEAGDIIYSINGRRTYTASDVFYMLTSAPDSTVEMTVERDGQKKDLVIEFDSAEQDGTNYLVMDFKVLGIRTSDMSVWQFIKFAAMDFLSMARLVWMSLFDLIAGRFGLNELMGPVGLVGTVSDAVSQAVTVGFENVVYLITLITINLGIVNLLPLPALDGGRIALLAVQGIIRRKIPEKYEALIHGIGFALLMILMVVIAFNDILRFFR